MKKLITVVFFTLISLSLFAQETPKVKPQKIQYTWNGKPVTYRQYRDSLRVTYNEFTTSQKSPIKKKKKS